MTIVLINIESFSSARALASRVNGEGPAAHDPIKTHARRREMNEGVIRNTQADETVKPPVDREHQFRTKATMAATAIASHAAMRIVPPVGAAIANRR